MLDTIGVSKRKLEHEDVQLMSRTLGFNSLVLAGIKVRETEFVSETHGLGRVVTAQAEFPVHGFPGKC